MNGSLRSSSDLVSAGLLPAAEEEDIADLSKTYAISITPEIAALINPLDPADPLAVQFIPSLSERVTRTDELHDPIGDDVHSPVPGIVHRYPDRVLLKLVHVCPVYCRFCFRREMVGPGAETHMSSEALAAALGYIESQPAIWEVILTGGDPLILSPRRLGELMDRLNAIPHVKIVRLHSRVPVVDTARITHELVQALRRPNLTTFVALHANHPREFTPAAKAACARLVDGGIAMVSQSVLLRGVNDTVETLAALMRGFVEMRVKPYYLHQGDLARGTSHLRVPMDEGRALMKALLGRVSGLCQPAFMLDIPGGYGKVPINADYLETGPDGCTVTDYQGNAHDYRL